MRRLLYLALAVVLLALTGLVFVRVTNSGAYVARSRLGRLQQGMAREDVLGVMDGLQTIGFNNESHRIEAWRCGEGYMLYVYYDKVYSDDQRLQAAFLGGPSPEDVRIVDRILDMLAYPRRLGDLPPSVR
jgi:hypothetical protein